jgi:hypothetical protein
MKTTVNTTLLALLSTISIACATGSTDDNAGLSFDQGTEDAESPDAAPLKPSPEQTAEASSSSSVVSSASATVSGSGGSDGHEVSGQGGTGGSDDGAGGSGGEADPSSVASSSSGGLEEPPPPPQPLSGCVDDIDVLGETFWSRADIVFCGTANKKLPADITAAKAMCAPGWHLCSHQEFADRNDLCPAHQENFSAILDDGEDCMMHDSGDTCPDCWKCNDDFVRSGYAGSCQGAQSSTGFSTRGRVQDSSGPAAHGSLCCL